MLSRILRRPWRPRDGEDIQAIATAEGVTELDVRAWVIQATQHERSATLHASGASIALGLLVLFTVLFFVPAEWREIPLGTSVVLGSCAALLAVAASVELWSQIAVRRWLPTRCRILANATARVNGGWMPVVFYEFSVGDFAYQSFRVRLAGPVSGAEEADAHRGRYPPGDTATCYYRPRRPGNAVLERVPYLRGAALIYALAIVCAGLASVV